MVKRVRKIHFYEVVSVNGPEEIRLSTQIDFGPWLAALSGLFGADRAHTTSDDELLYSDTRMSEEGGPQLILLRVRGQTGYEAQVNTDTGEILEIDPGSPTRQASTALAYFLPFGNLVAVVMPMGGPTLKHLNEFVQAKLEADGAELRLRPLMSSAQLEKLRRGDSVARVAFRVGVGAPPINGGSAIARAVRLLREAVPDANIDLSLTTVGKGKHQSREAIRSGAIELAESGGSLMRMDARVINYGLDDEEISEVVNLMEHAVTAHTTFEAVGDEGEVLNLGAAVHAVERVVLKMSDDLLALTAVSVGRQ